MTETASIAFNWNIPSEIDHFQFADRIQWWRCNRRKCLSTAAGEVEFIVLSGISLSWAKSRFEFMNFLSISPFHETCLVMVTLYKEVFRIFSIRVEMLTKKQWLTAHHRSRHPSTYLSNSRTLFINILCTASFAIILHVKWKNEEELESIGNAENS